MARAAWSRDGRLASWTRLGRDLVDRNSPVLEKVIQPQDRLFKISSILTGLQAEGFEKSYVALIAANRCTNSWSHESISLTYDLTLTPIVRTEGGTGSLTINAPAVF
jgi:hypothetical protein